MEHSDREEVAAFFCDDEPLQRGVTVSLGPDVARHVRARRLTVGSPVAVLDGAGHRAAGRIVAASRVAVAVELSDVLAYVPLPEVHLLVPIADRDRMLWLGEKVTELGATSWRPVLWRRSRSVKPRGEGMTFQGRLRSRMTSALEQSGGAWLPQLHPDAPLARALAAAPQGTRLVLDRGGRPVASAIAAQSVQPVTLAIGPEGGLERAELETLAAAHFQPVRLGGNMLRFETAAVAALAVVRSLLDGPAPLTAHVSDMSLLQDR
ncbi:MAG: RsmE family RNA methyltransferase [Gemmatimonadaceae bacterium]